MLALSPAISRLSQLTPQAIRRLAPYLLGAPLWAQVTSSVFADWDEFKEKVDQEVGMTEEEERAQFYSMRLGSFEKDQDFVLRVEAQRKLVVPHDSTTQMVLIFAPRMTIQFRMRLEQARSIKALAAGGRATLTWADVVSVAQDLKYSARLLSDEEMSGAASTTIGPTATTTSAPTHPSTTTTRPAAEVKQPPSSTGGTAGTQPR